MDPQLKGKTAFVSGSSSGIGLGIALELAAEGQTWSCMGATRPAPRETARQVEAKGVRAAVTLGEDLCNREGKRAPFCDAALDAFGHIDILINNCGRTLRYDNPDWSVLESSGLGCELRGQRARGHPPGTSVRPRG